MGFTADPKVERIEKVETQSSGGGVVEATGKSGKREKKRDALPCGIL
jgi:hypothetical protein